MLVLSRKKDETIKLPLGGGRLLVIAVVSIQGDKVRIGIEAPADMPIFRGEVMDEIAYAEAKSA